MSRTEAHLTFAAVELEPIDPGRSAQRADLEIETGAVAVHPRLGQPPDLEAR